jgi:hypothetical protein
MQHNVPESVFLYCKNRKGNKKLVPTGILYPVGTFNQSITEKWNVDIDLFFFG